MVTGAGTGFGAAVAVRAAQEGAARVLVHYRSSSGGAERTAERVRAEGAGAALVQGDITSWADIKRMVQWAFEEHRGIDVLVNTFAPGFMETEALLARPEWKAGRRETVLSGTPTGRIPGQRR
jgi:NAD(P)-dependent dehydrogenase (short-subunit alcohol dehydrogenase family)